LFVPTFLKRVSPVGWLGKQLPTKAGSLFGLVGDRVGLILHCLHDEIGVEQAPRLNGSIVPPNVIAKLIIDW
jgi:hypothetical protein